MIKRVICDIVLFLSVFFLPWYLTAILAAIFIILFRYFWEGALAALFMDAIHSVPTNGVYAHFGLFTVLAVILILIIEKVRTRLRFL